MNMKRIRTITALVVASFAATAGAQAQEWNGAYASIYAGSTNFNEFEYGVQVGYSVGVGEGIYAGVEADVLFPVGVDYVAAVAGRVGYEISPNVFAFAKAGLGATSGGTNYWLAGAGASYGITDNIAIRAELDRYQVLGGAAVNWVPKLALSYGF